jgi:hypothetical protein
MNDLGIVQPGEFVVYVSQDERNRGLYFERITERISAKEVISRDASRRIRFLSSTPTFVPVSHGVKISIRADFPLEDIDMYDSEFGEEDDSDEENLDGIKTLDLEGHPDGLFERVLQFGTILSYSIKSGLVKDLVEVLLLAYERQESKQQVWNISREEEYDGRDKSIAEGKRESTNRRITSHNNSNDTNFLGVIRTRWRKGLKEF